MMGERTGTFVWTAGHCLLGLGAIAVVTVVSRLLDLGGVTPGLLYIFIVVLLSLSGRFVPAAVTSIGGAIALQAFFISPSFTLDHIGEVDVVDTSVSLLISLLVTRLVSSRRRTLIASREQAALLDLTHDTVFVRDMKDVITFWNRGAEDLYGWKKQEALGKVSHDFMKTVFPEPLPTIMAELTRTGRWEGELVHARRDGAKVVVASRWSVQRDRHGRPTAILETNNDVTARKQAEERLLEMQSDLAHTVRVTTLGELAASIAHEVNQPLTAIVSDASACLHWLDANPPALDNVREGLAAVVKDGNRAADVIARIRAMIARSSVARAPCDVAEVVRDVLIIVGPELARRGVTLSTSLDAKLPQLLGDRVQLQQVILNLLMNAADAVRDVPAERRRVSVRSVTERRADGPRVVVDVEDDGVGLPADGDARLFEAFYSTKPSGLGMGLAICRSIVEAHDGRLWATANPKHGATFHVELPGIR